MTNAHIDRPWSESERTPGSQGFLFEKLTWVRGLVGLIKSFTWPWYLCPGEPWHGSTGTLQGAC